MRRRTVSTLYLVIVALALMVSELWVVCAHVATVLWFLGFGKHQSEIPIPTAFLNDVCVELGGQEQQ
jgi:hypothetical protein